MQTARRIIHTRPITCFTASSFAVLCSYAYALEWQSDQNQLRYEANKLDYDGPPVKLPRKYDREMIETYWERRPITVALRLASIGTEFLPIFWTYLRDFKILPSITTTCNRQNIANASNEISSFSEEEVKLQHEHAVRLREALTRLGPAFVKAGQQLSIRPDLIPPSVLKELQRLCDSVEPVSDEIAMRILVEEIGEEKLKEFVDLHLVASASLGQVYKATLKKTGQSVAIKVQRPDMLKSVSLDLFLLNKYGQFVDAFCDTFTEQVAFHVNFIDCFAKGSYSELDYENEAINQQYFKDEFKKRKCKVKVPSIHSQFSSRRVLTTEWVDGVKLADADSSTIRKLIPLGVELFLTQLLDIGSFHADPHPGNLYVTKAGELCLLDFGLCADIDQQSRRAMTTAIVHLLTGDFDSLIAKDAKDLGFLPSDLDVTELKPILSKILTEGLLESGSNMHARKRRLMAISNELNEVFFRYPFSVPPFFALITRGLGLLEGIALSGDPDFDIFQASYPYARRRAIEVFGAHGFGRLRRNTTKMIG